jgi:uncharacterized coiled-coil DUF342 family protein
VIISKELKREVIEIGTKFSEINSEYDALNNNLHALIVKRDNLLARLSAIRDDEKKLINKIEAEIGTELTADLANKIMNG